MTTTTTPITPADIIVKKLVKKEVIKEIPRKKKLMLHVGVQVKPPEVIILRHYDLQTQTDPIKKPLMIEQSH